MLEDGTSVSSVATACSRASMGMQDEPVRQPTLASCVTVGKHALLA